MNQFGFSLLRSKVLPEIGGTLHEMEHVKTGAKLIWLERSDDNKTFGIAFTTLPEDSTGVFHILEHSVLCGSDKYPVKEPFVELLKNSMNTFLNAMTFPDKTFYPVSSRNEKDFLNLMRVYLDAVFHPLIYSKPEIFYQEGWHYEFDENGSPSYKGVVFNEMKGAYASADQQMANAMQEMLFPDNCYRFSSGGDPAVIPDLSYEAFLDAHRRFYSPSNSFIFLDGDMDIELVLSILDQEYLSTFERGDRIAPPAMQQSINAGTKHVAYELGQEESPDNRYRVAWGNVIGTYDNKETLIAMQALSQVLCSSNQSPLPKCILEKGIAEDVVMQIQDGVLQPWVLLEVRNCKKEDISTIERTIREELNRLTNGGLDHEQLIAQMANMEFRMRERDYGGMPRGLVFGFNALETWLYGGDPAVNLEVGTLFDDLREKLEQGYFEDLLRRVLMDNPHTCQVIMEPSHTAGEERRQAEQKRLADEADSWTDAQRQSLKERQARIQAWQESTDSPEALATLPRLDLKDISAEPEDIPTELTEIAGIPVLKHEVACGGIVYCTLYFDLADRTEEELSAASMLCGLLGELPTETSTAEQLMNRKQLLCGMFQCQVRSFAKENRPDVCERKLCVSFSALESNLPDAIDLVVEILTQTKYDGENAVLDILRQRKMMLMQQIVMAGSGLAAGRVAAQTSVSGVVDECANGYQFYIWLKNQEENWNWQDINTILKNTANEVFCTGRLTISVTCADPNAAGEITAKLSAKLCQGETGEKHNIHPWGKRKEGIAIPADISFAVKGGSILYNGGAYNGVLPLASRIIGLGYLWNTIRVQGGAYGAGLIARNTGLACCYSYRDPNATRSLEQYDGAAEFLRGICIGNTDLTGFIIGAVSDDSPLLTPRMQGMTADSRYWTGIDLDSLRQHRRELLECTADELATVANSLEKTIADGGICVIGAQKQLEACNLDGILTI